MTAVAKAGTSRGQGLAFGVAGLLALVVFINYVDRGNLATAAPLIKDELKLSGTQIGLLLSAFFWTYVPSQLLAARLAERINAYRTLAIGVAIWSIATAASALATSFWALIALRLLLGLGESAAFPCIAKIFAGRLPTPVRRRQWPDRGRPGPRARLRDLHRRPPDGCDGLAPSISPVRPGLAIVALAVA